MVKENICIAASAGGHLNEALQLKESWAGKKHFFISDERVNAKALARTEKMYYIMPARRNPLRLAYGFLQTSGIFLRENPSTIISTGAESAFPAIILGVILGKRVVYIESFARISSPSLCGKLVYPYVKDFYVQWPQGKKWFPKAKYIGSVF
ncbi:MAG: PssD/Cps14F family polysaccharide biosynthesis glycosyltransferase [archaeon]